ncbi:hypothetical protein C2E20_9021 [Micractinium conductrix]|uniref:Uncharacterized protein n=1 Tax=Micractinium conductrix TaxID=554055 RepID=A0A2P6UZQ9_9CHLO|nr:hypothetical protein C2E20_9021 [Micractinium conductrix]|eukprot:PSC67284.1 hypothetical protein C2E20_9021 [Micractinium conductrix]
MTLCRIKPQKTLSLGVPTTAFCELLTLVDLDVKVASMYIPLLDVLQRDFNFTEPSLIAMSIEPDLPQDWLVDILNERKLAQNTGFVVARNKPRMQEILMQWLNCTRDDSAQRCEECVVGWPCEQCAWAKYIRPTLLPSEYTVLPCTHFNSWPNVQENMRAPNCDIMGGFVVQHYWSGKDVAFERFNSELNNTDVAWRQQGSASIAGEPASRGVPGLLQQPASPGSGVRCRLGGSVGAAGVLYRWLCSLRLLRLGHLAQVARHHGTHIDVLEQKPFKLCVKSKAAYEYVANLTASGLGDDIVMLVDAYGVVLRGPQQQYWIDTWRQWATTGWRWYDTISPATSPPRCLSPGTPLPVHIEFNYEPLPYRPGGLNEATSDLRAPSFDSCIATPGGVRLMPFMQPLLRPLTNLSVMTLAELSARSAVKGKHGHPGRCFQQAYICVYDRPDFGLMYDMLQHTVQWYQERQALPASDVGFDGGNDTLKVLIESRGGTYRSLINAPKLVTACNDFQGFKFSETGPWKRVQCSVLSPCAWVTLGGNVASAYLCYTAQQHERDSGEVFDARVS